jgi:hypothetical protein
MSHDYHEGPDDAVIYDGCGECDDRAAEPLSGLLTLDAANFERLRARMLAVEYGDSDHYRTGNEARLGSALYKIQILHERHGRVIA